MRTAPFASLRSLFDSSDEQAMWRVQTQDDESAFAQLVRRWQGPIQRLCGRMTGDLHRGEDVAQEAFARVFAKRKDYQSSGKFSTWLWRIALNLCYDELRRRQRREESSLDGMRGEAIAALEAFVEPKPAPDKLLVEQERSELVRRALMQLSETYRTVLVLRHYESLKFREIADVLGVPEGTVKSRMAEALTQMSRLLKPMLTDPEPVPRLPDHAPHEPGAPVSDPARRSIDPSPTGRVEDRRSVQGDAPCTSAGKSLPADGDREESEGRGERLLAVQTQPTT